VTDNSHKTHWTLRQLTASDVNKARSVKTKAKATTPKAKAKTTIHKAKAKAKSIKPLAKASAKQ
jgi:hypothetical protein